MRDFFTTQQVADMLGYSDSAVIRLMIRDGKIEAQKFGVEWAISIKEVVRLQKIRESNKNDKIEATLAE